MATPYNPVSGKDHHSWSGGLKALGSDADKALTLTKENQDLIASIMLGRAEVGNDDECWEWMGHLSEDGYARTGGMIVSRLMYVLINKKPLGKLKALHTCDNPKCVNYNHIFAGTQLDNMKDMQSKGRERKANGVDLPHSKLDENKVREIRRLVASGLSMASVARMYGVAATSIHKIVSGRSWRHVQ